MSGRNENDIILLVMCQNGVSGLADRMPWVSMPLSQNGFTMLTCITFLAFGCSLNVPLMLLSSWLLTLHAWNTRFIMAKRMCMALEHSYFRECSLTLLMLGWWKLVSSLLLMPVYVWTQPIDENFARVSSTFFVLLWWFYT